VNSKSKIEPTVKPAEPTLKPAEPADPDQPQLCSLERIMKKVALTPNHLYRLYCEYFKLPLHTPTVSSDEIFRYGIRVPAKFQKLM